MPLVESKLPLQWAALCQCDEELRQLRAALAEEALTGFRPMLSHHTTTACQPGKALGSVNSLKASGLDEKHGQKGAWRVLVFLEHGFAPGDGYWVQFCGDPKPNFKDCQVEAAQCLLMILLANRPRGVHLHESTLRSVERVRQSALALHRAALALPGVSAGDAVGWDAMEAHERPAPGPRDRQRRARGAGGTEAPPQSASFSSGAGQPLRAIAVGGTGAPLQSTSSSSGAGQPLLAIGAGGTGAPPSSGTGQPLLATGGAGPLPQSASSSSGLGGPGVSAGSPGCWGPPAGSPAKHAAAAVAAAAAAAAAASAAQQAVAQQTQALQAVAQQAAALQAAAREAAAQQAALRLAAAQQAAAQQATAQQAPPQFAASPLRLGGPLVPLPLGSSLLQTPPGLGEPGVSAGSPGAWLGPEGPGAHLAEAIAEALAEAPAQSFYASSPLGAPWAGEQGVSGSPAAGALAEGPALDDAGPGVPEAIGGPGMSSSPAFGTLTVGPALDEADVVAEMHGPIAAAALPSNWT